MEALKEKNDSIIKENANTSKLNIEETIQNLICIFFAASIVGWIYEMIFYKLTENVLINRGFLYGPYVPVYGVGAVLIVFLLKRFRNKPVYLFILTALVTGILEYIVGAFMLFVWNKRWWDYTGLFLNINGHVCLRSVISFALGGFALIYLLEPLINKLNKKINVNKRRAICISIVSIIAVDLVLCLTIRHPIKFQ